MLDGGDTVHVRHLQVHEDQVWLEFGDKAQAFYAVSGFANYFDVVGGFKDKMQTLTHHQVIVGDQYSHQGFLTIK